MTRLLLSIFLLLTVNTLRAQDPVFEWAGKFGSAGIDNGRSIAVDPLGNVYSIGLFFNSVDFDPGPGTYNMTAAGDFDMAIYISKLNTSGQFLWAKQIPTEIEGPMALTVDKSGNVYVTSEVRQVTDMDPGPGVFNMTPSTPFRDAFVLKLNTNGEFVWAKQFRGLMNDTGPFGSAITIDENNDVLICGGFNNSVDFDPGPATFSMTSTGTYEVYITKLNANGDFLFARKLGNFDNRYDQLYIQDVKTDQQGNIYTTGHFTGNSDFDPGPSEFRMQAAGPGEGFISKLDKHGNFVWAKHIGNSAFNNIVFSNGIEIDGAGNVYIAGGFHGEQDFDPGPDKYHLTSEGSMDGFLLKLNSSGQFKWVRKIGGETEDILYDIVTDNLNNVYVTGFFSGTIDFDPGPGVAEIALYDAATIVKFNDNGDFLYVAPFVDGVSGGRQLAVDKERSIYATGYFAGQVDFDPGIDEYFLYGDGGYDAFIVKLSKCLHPTTAVIDVVSCDSYTLNHYTYDTSGIYTQTLRNASGCDSIITLELTINRVFTEQTKIICAGEKIYAAGSDQYLPGDYTDTLTTYLGCDSIVATHLIVHPAPSPRLGEDRPICESSTLTISPGNFDGYEWQDGSIQPSFVVTDPGAFSVKVKNNYGCYSSDTMMILNKVPLPADFLRVTDTMCRNGEFILQPMNDFTNYQWSTGSTSKTTTISYPGEYRLAVTDVNGCTGKDTIIISAKECSSGVFIPTAFTPNNDGKNDVFIVATRAELEQFTLQVFNRWGHVVFETNDPRKGWNGSVKGAGTSTNIYAWQCSYKLKNGGSFFQKGTVILLR